MRADMLMEMLKYRAKLRPEHGFVAKNFHDMYGLRKEVSGTEVLDCEFDDNLLWSARWAEGNTTRNSWLNFLYEALNVNRKEWFVKALYEITTVHRNESFEPLWFAPGCDTIEKLLQSDEYDDLEIMTWEAACEHMMGELTDVVEEMYG
jgi:hypothetical protein